MTRQPTPDILADVLETRTTQIRAGRIQADGGTQMRAGLDSVTIQDYAEAMADRGWGSFPPVVVYHDGEAYWLADGFHRLAAWRSLVATGDTLIPADVRPGTRRDAILHAASANAAHGLRRTNADKRRAVETLLRDEEWRQWSDGVIAQRCAVSDRFVAAIRRDLTPNGSESTTIRRAADGRTINTARIGRTPTPASTPMARNLPPADAHLPTWAADPDPEPEPEPVAPPLAADPRVAALHGWIARLETLLADLDAWGELTGKFGATLELERGAQRMIDASRAELDALTTGRHVDDEWGMA